MGLTVPKLNYNSPIRLDTGCRVHIVAQSNGWPTVDQNQPNQQQQAAAQPSDANPYQDQQQPQDGNAVRQSESATRQSGELQRAPQAGPRPPYGQNPNPYAQQAPPPPIPAQLTLSPGTYVTVRINQKLSSDHSHPGDAFTATLEQPLVVNGVVVAEPGETVGGVVTKWKKAAPQSCLSN